MLLLKVVLLAGVGVVDDVGVGVDAVVVVGEGVAGDGVVGKGVAGDGVVGEGVAGDGVVGEEGVAGDDVVGEGVTGDGVVGEGAAGDGVVGGVVVVVVASPAGVVVEGSACLFLRAGDGVMGVVDGDGGNAEIQKIHIITTKSS